MKRKDCHQYIKDINNISIKPNLVKQTIGLIDLTSLNDNDTDDTVVTLCEQANTPQGNVAALCIYPRFISLVKETLPNKNIRIATVVNFPEGTHDVKRIIDDIQAIKELGADEIDMVLPYQAYLSGNARAALKTVETCKDTCGQKTVLKVILETGAFKTPEDIYKASHNVISAGADFIKTSTGKIKTGATLEAACAMLLAIREAGDTGKSIGFKASGGIRTVNQAMAYIHLTQHIMGADWITDNNMRIGASSLVSDILQWLTKHEV